MLFNEFARSPRRFFLRLRYEFSWKTPVFFILLTDIYYLFLSFASSFLGDRPLSMISDIFWSVSLFILFVPISHLLIAPNGRLVHTVAVFAYSQIPMILSMPLVYAYDIFNSFSPVEYRLAEELVIMWIWLFFWFYSAKLYITGMSLVHKKAGFWVSVVVIALILVLMISKILNIPGVYLWN